MTVYGKLEVVILEKNCVIYYSENVMNSLTNKQKHVVNMIVLVLQYKLCFKFNNG